MDLVRTRAITNNTQGNDDFVKSLSRTLLRIKSSIDTCEVDIRDNWWKTEWKKEVQAYLDETDAESISRFLDFVLSKTDFTMIKIEFLKNPLHTNCTPFNKRLLENLVIHLRGSLIHYGSKA